MDEDAIFDHMDEQTQKAIDHAIHEFATVNTGKASPSMVEDVMVEAYGGMMALKELSAISTPDARTIAVQPWDKTVLKAVEKAIQSANLGINPVIVGEVVRLPLPELTRERRQELAKLAHKYAEEAKVGVRKGRHDAMDAMKKLQKDSEITEDDLKRNEKEIQNKTDAAVKEIESLLAAKEKDLLTV